MKRQILGVALLIFLIPPAAISQVLVIGDDIGIVPCVTLSWDLNIGLNVSGGLIVGRVTAKPSGTAWDLYDGAIIASGGLGLRGHNLSLGVYVGEIPQGSFQLGVNRTVVRTETDSDVYWGLQFSSGGPIRLRLGAMLGLNRSENPWRLLFRPNFAIGLGILPYLWAQQSS